VGSVWKALVAFVQLLWYNLVSAAETLRREKTLREAADAQAKSLEESRLRDIEAEIEKDIREGKEILASPNPAAGARDFLRESFPRDN
jgi:hypothetical protein